MADPRIPRRGLIAPDPSTDPEGFKFAPVTYQPPIRTEPTGTEAKPGYIWVKIGDELREVPYAAVEEMERQHLEEMHREADLDNPLLRTLPRQLGDPGRFDEEREGPTALQTPDPSQPDQVPPNQQTYVVIRKPDGKELRIPMLMVQRVLGLGIHGVDAACHANCKAASLGRVGKVVLCEHRRAFPTLRLVRANMMAIALRAVKLGARRAAILLRRAAVEISIKIDDEGAVTVSPPGAAPAAPPPLPALDVEAKRREISDVVDKVVAEKGGPGQQGHFWTDGERVVYVSKAFLWALEDDPQMGLRVPNLSGSVLVANLTDRFFAEQAGGDWMNHHVPLAEWKNFRRLDRGAAERMLLDRAIRQAPKVAAAVEIVRTAQGPRWAAPDLSADYGAIERAAKQLGISAGAILAAARKGRMFELGDSAWAKLENSRSWSAETLSAAREAAGDDADRNFDHVLHAFWAGAKLGAPIVLLKPDGAAYLISGDSRLMAARALGLRPRVYVVRWPEGARMRISSVPPRNPGLLRIAIVKRCNKGDGESGKPWCLYAHDGKLLGRHDTQESAYKQEAAIKSRGGSAIEHLDRAAESLEDRGHADLAERVDRIATLMVIASGTGTKEPGGPPVSVDDTEVQRPDTIGPSAPAMKGPGGKKKMTDLTRWDAR